MDRKSWLHGQPALQKGLWVETTIGEGATSVEQDSRPEEEGKRLRGTQEEQVSQQGAVPMADRRKIRMVLENDIGPRTTSRKKGSSKREQCPRRAEIPLRA